MLAVSVMLVLFAVFLLFLQFLKLQWMRRQFPPGPTPYPIFGNLLQMNFQIHHEILKKMAKIHGNVFTLWLSKTPVVVLQGFQAVKEGLTVHAEDVAGRPVKHSFHLLTHGNGVMFSNGHLWKQQRRFGLATMRKMGVGKKDQEYRLQKEAGHLVEYLRKTNGKPLDPTMPVVHTVANVICSVIFGHRFSKDDENFHCLIESIDTITAFGNSVFFFTKGDDDATYDEENLIQTMFDLFLAGTETTATTLRWALLYMVIYPDIQEKVQKELDDVLGCSHLICYEDRKKLPYTNAVIHEIQRYSNVVLIALPRQSVKDTFLLGFPVPKDTMILANIDSVLSDPGKWETPEQFNPEHFLDKDGNFVNREAFLPFSIGHRVCMGELLARMELFIVFCTLLQAFTFTLPEGVKEANTKLQQTIFDKDKQVEAVVKMLTIGQFLIALAVFLLIMQFLKLQHVRRQLPPGPTPLPVFGTLMQLNFQFNRDLLMKMATVHGNIFTLWFGWAPVIVLNGFQAVKDGMTTHPEDVSGRLVSPFFRAMAKGKGIMLATGHTWKQQRRFALKTLRNLGLGKRGLEHRVQEEAHYLVDFFASMKGKPVDPSFPLVHSVSNVICAVVFGHRFSREDEAFRELIRATERLFKFGGSFIHHLYEIFPWLMCRLPGPHKKALSCYDVLSNFTRREIRMHTERGIPEEEQDFIDFYLAHIEKSKDEPRSTYNEDNMVYSINDLFLGGSETTSTTLNWGLLYMVANPDVQEKVQKELDAVLGPSQLICYEDRRELPYTNAVVHEIQRFSNIISVGMPRVCVRNTTLLGFPLKKGTIVLPNIASSLYDPEQWETPRQFNPGHFLDKDGNFVSQEAFLPFSIGHRVCLGEHLARTELFIFFANLLRAFTFRLPEGMTKINTEPILGGTLQPHPYRVCAIPR
ncbi:cytochrome P450 2J4-like [Phaethornis superciliosus]